MKRLGLTLIPVLLSSMVLAQSAPPTPGYGGSTSPAAGATPAPSGAGTAQPGQAAKKTGKTSAVLSEPITLSGTSSAAAKLPDLAADPRLSGIPLDKVILLGNVSSSERSSQGQAATVQWYGVTLNDSTKAAHLAEPLNGRFRSTSESIQSGTSLPAKGNVDGLVTAIRSLFEGKTETAAQKQPPTAAKAAQPTQPQAGGTPSGNDVAAAYKPLPITPAAAEAKESPTASGTTLDGCSPKVDFTQGVVIQQSSPTTTKDGITTKGACSDTEIRWPIQYTSAECNDDVQVSSMTAYPQQKPYYVDAGGATIYLGTCERVKDKAFPITADASHCSPFVDIGGGSVKEQTELVYTDANNKRVVADGCTYGRTGGKTWPIVYSSNGCQRRDDFTAHKSWDQVKPTYVKDGVTVTVGDCADTGNGYTMTEDTAACDVSLDLQAKTATRMSKWRIDTASGPVYVSNCTPTGTPGALVATVEGCESIHTDYFEAGYSRGAERLYHTLAGNGVRSYVTECQESTTQHTHDLILEGWEYNDGLRKASQKLAVYINLPAPAGRTMISAAAVRSQSVTQDYVLDRIAEVPNGTSTYTGCSAYRNTDKSEVYKRPDDTEYAYAIGAGTPTGPVDVCVDTVVDSRQMETGVQRYNPIPGTGSECGYAVAPGENCTSWNPENGCMAWQPAQAFPYYNRMAWLATVNKYDKKNVENGTVVTTHCGFANGVWKSTTNMQGQYCHTSVGIFPQIGTAGIKNGITHNTIGENTGSLDYQRLGSGATLSSCPF